MGQVNFLLFTFSILDEEKNRFEILLIKKLIINIVTYLSSVALRQSYQLFLQFLKNCHESLFFLCPFVGWLIGPSLLT